MDDLSDIRELYNAGWEREQSRLSERHQLEADLTWRYLNAYLPATGRILEVGFGTGFYTIPLAERGYSITGVDLADEFVSGCRARVAELGLSHLIHLQIGDARTLEGIPRGTYDAVLLMGPLYHLVYESERTNAIQAAFECLRPGGVLFSALISRFGVLGNLLRDKPFWIDGQEGVWSHIRHGHRPFDAAREGFRGYFVRLDEIRPMHERVGFDTEAVAGVEPAISADDESYNNLEGKRRDLWLDVLYEVSREESMVASSRHILYVGKRPRREAAWST